MQSLLALYDGKRVETRIFPGRLRGTAWEEDGASIMLVGDSGRIMRVQGSRVVNIDAGTKHNLRAVSISPVSQTTLAVGNAGTIISILPNGRTTKLNSFTSENLRTVRWNSKGDTALIAGNNGALIKYADGRLESIDGCRANLRGVSWRNEHEALITSNCFAEQFVPSPNLFAFNTWKNTVTSLNEDQSDLIGVAWKPDGVSAIVVGYNVVWHKGFIGRVVERAVTSVSFENDAVYPAAVGWDASGHMAALATSAAQAHLGHGEIILWDEESFREIFRSQTFFFSSVTWDPQGMKLAALASTGTRIFNC